MLEVTSDLIIFNCFSVLVMEINFIGYVVYFLLSVRTCVTVLRIDLHSYVWNICLINDNSDLSSTNWP